MKKIRLLVPAIGLASIVTVVPLAVTSCKKGDETRKITIDDKAALAIIKNEQDIIEVTVQSKDTAMHVVSVVIKIGDHQLTSGEFSFVKAEGRIIIPKEVCHKYSGNVEITTTNEKKVIIELDRDAFILFVGKTSHIKAQVTPPEATIIWESSDKTRATVNNDGFVTALVADKDKPVIITATVNGVSARCKVFIYNPIESKTAIMATATEPTNFSWSVPPFPECSESWIQYSFDGETFEDLIPGEIIKFGDDGAREIMYLRGNIINHYVAPSTMRGNNLKFTTESANSIPSVILSGNIMNLLQKEKGKTGTEMPENCAFYGLFAEADAIVGFNETEENPFLPATTLQPQCYAGMFEHCFGLKKAPILKATTLAKECYYNMFYHDRNLIEAPELPATTLAPYCYWSMFKDCVGLITPPELPATDLVNSCYWSMFGGCTKLSKTPTIVINSMEQQSCLNMFNNCENLITQDVTINTTKTEYEGFASMFSGCQKLTSIPDLSSITLIEEGCYRDMFSGCKTITTAPTTLPGPIAKECYSGMFRNCSSLKNAPKLGKSTDVMAQNCCYEMFAFCDALTTVEPDMLPSISLDKNCYSGMFRFCKALTNAPQLPAEDLPEGCYNEMFKNCSSLKITESSSNAPTLFFTCPETGKIKAESVVDMFLNTAGPFKDGTPTAGKKYSYGE